MLGDDLYGVLDAAVGHRHLLTCGSSLRETREIGSGRVAESSGGQFSPHYLPYYPL